MENTIAALRNGADDFISKPLNLDELHSALTSSMARKRQLSAGGGNGKAGKSCLLIVSDSAERVAQLRSVLSQEELETSAAFSLDDLEQVCHGKHDLVVIDVGPQEIRATLKALRESSAHTSIPVLVATGRLDCEPGLSGVLPQYRAMPCGPAEMIRLVRRLTTPMDEKEVRHFL